MHTANGHQVLSRNTIQNISTGQHSATALTSSHRSTTNGPTPKVANQVPTSLNNRVPPPLVPVNGTTDGVSEVEEIIDISSPPSSPTPARNSILDRFVTEIPEMVNGQIASGQSPYRVQRVTIRERLVNCINAKPYEFNNQDLLMKVEDLVKQFFPDLQLQSMLKALQHLEVSVFKLNR